MVMVLALLIALSTYLAAQSTAVHTAVAFDLSPPLNEQFIPDKTVVIHPAVESRARREGSPKGPGKGLGSTPPAPQLPRAPRTSASAPIPPQPPAPEIGREAAAVEQTAQGDRPPVPIAASFDGLGEAFHESSFKNADTAGRRGGIDISLAVGPDHIFEILDGNMAVFTKKGKKYPETGKLLYGPVPNQTIFDGFGVRCRASNNSDSVVRYDQLAGRWLIVVPVFTRPPDNPQGPYAMCYAVSATPDPLGPYYRYEFERPLFPDYPRPAVWPDGYYNPTSTSDNLLPDVITQKHDCIADRNKMLKGLPATEQCVIIDGGVFMLNADLDGSRPPPAGRAEYHDVDRRNAAHEDFRGRRNLFLQGPRRLERSVEDHHLASRKKFLSRRIIICATGS